MHEYRHSNSRIMTLCQTYHKGETKKTGRRRSAVAVSEAGGARSGRRTLRSRRTLDLTEHDCIALICQVHSHRQTKLRQFHAQLFDLSL